MINPSVSNADKSCHYVAFILEDLNKKLGVPLSRGVIERAIKDGKCGSTCDSRYFVKEGVTTKTGSRCKARCCTVKKDVLSSENLKRLYKGKYAVYF